MRPYACVERRWAARTDDYELSPARCVFAYDGVHAQNREALTDRITFIVRIRSQASRRDDDRAGRPTTGGASISFSGITRQCEATPGREERQRGYDEATFVESFVVLNAAGGECLDDFERLRADPGLGQLIGHEVPSPEAARKFLYAFHEEEKIQQAKQQRLPEQIAYIPSESEPLEGLGKVNQDLIQRLGERCPEQKIATVDQDTTIIESRKQEALHTYEGPRGYQPMLAVWAEMDVVLADEFR